MLALKTSEQSSEDMAGHASASRTFRGRRSMCLHFHHAPNKSSASLWCYFVDLKWLRFDPCLSPQFLVGEGGYFRGTFYPVNVCSTAQVTKRTG